jgi:hypothetical protein
MTVALAVALSLAPSQAGKLALTHARLTQGLLGPVRPDAKLLPGDSLFLAFDIDGLQADASGKAQYSVGMAVANSQGKVQFKQEPRNLEAINALGGNRLPAHAHIDIGVDQPPGDYTLSVTVADRSTKATQTIAQKFQVLPKALGVVRLRLTGDPEGQVPLPGTGVVGQPLFIHCGLVGFERDKAKKQPNVSFEMRVLDESGKPTLAKPFTGVVNQDVPENAASVPLQFVLPLNRAGKFTVEIKATDQVAKKSATLSFPYAVIESK